MALHAISVLDQSINQGVMSDSDVGDNQVFSSSLVFDKV